MFRWIALVLCSCVFAVSGCGDAQAPAPDAAPTDSRVPDDNVFSSQVQALEKAQGVQKTLDEALARQRESIEQQGE